MEGRATGYHVRKFDDLEHETSCYTRTSEAIHKQCEQLDQTDKKIDKSEKEFELKNQLVPGIETFEAQFGAFNVVEADLRAYCAILNSAKVVTILSNDDELLNRLYRLVYTYLPLTVKFITKKINLTTSNAIERISRLNHRLKHLSSLNADQSNTHSTYVAIKRLMFSYAIKHA
ncbi:hypothetical protein DFA_10568 [Cavenderia fasciculata]|uniref:Uncharacterized protein n=1 Tax=Cavenderia fasciculata TaxID=261658 RepID=F4QAK7_CACFS|nr:uncharacterized protein DFA_10568 [Cavenderia fasciculata]EGG15726.1 hypothetical protein DFA_10568 [Cavenderia fasciculata]|eukprot:XP_004354468.1 hypothetical protein DFA_10568 [Cavenderia fasciculata]